MSPDTSHTPPQSTHSPTAQSQRSQWHNGNRAFLDASVPELVNQLTKLEKIKLLAGADWWHTVPIHRLNIPGVKMSDGPNGARGASFAEQTAGICIPCETALAATFSPTTVYSAAALLANEAKDRGAVALLAPTVNIQRSPLGGRAFESFSEDPELSGLMATAYIKGLQENGVSSVLKHFVCNDQEHERSAVNVEVSERALREVYLKPFASAIKDANPLSIMTSYNRLRGVHVAESKELLDEMLRREWGYTGMVMSDWFGTYSVAAGIIAGQDLEMPGPAKWRTQYLVDHSLMSRKITQRHIDARITKILEWSQNCTRLSPDVVYGDDLEVTSNRPGDREVSRHIAASSVVVLKNDHGALPLRSDVASIAVIGPRATAKTCFGGGSAQLNTSYVVTVLEGLENGAPIGTSVRYSLGTPAHKLLPYLDPVFNEAGEPGMDMRLFANRLDMPHHSRSIRHLHLANSSALISDDIPSELEHLDWFGSLTGSWVSPSTGAFEFSVSVCGRARLYIDETLIVDAWDSLQRPGETFFGQGTEEEKGVYHVEQGRTYRIRCEYSNVAGQSAASTVKDEAQPIHNFGVQLGGFPVIDSDRAMDEAVALAKTVDAVILSVGLGPDFESESFDRADLSLPLRTNELVEKVAAANPRTIVALQTGSAVSLPWIDSVASVIQAWYGGNESGNAIADIVYGKVNPSGRLPITFPKREEDVPAYTNFKSHQGIVRYGEDLSVGYKWYQSRKIEPLFPFGHGLSYTSFSYANLKVNLRSGTNDIAVEFSFDITNSGSTAGSHAAQLYLSHPVPTATSLYHPERTLGGIAFMTDIPSGETKSANIKLDRRSFSHWDDIIERWRVEKGQWCGMLCADALGDAQVKATFEVEKAYEWLGL